MKKKSRLAGGVLITAKDTNRVFLLLRNGVSRSPNTWSMVAGTIEDGETPLKGLKREVGEELSIDPEIIDYKFICTETSESRNLYFSYFGGEVKSEFVPTLNDENTDFGWFDKDDLPSPLFEGMVEKIAKI